MLPRSSKTSCQNLQTSPNCSSILASGRSSYNARIQAMLLGEEARLLKKFEIPQVGKFRLSVRLQFFRKQFVTSVVTEKPTQRNVANSCETLDWTFTVQSDQAQHGLVSLLSAHTKKLVELVTLLQQTNPELWSMLVSTLHRIPTLCPTSQLQKHFRLNK